MSAPDRAPRETLAEFLPSRTRRALTLAGIDVRDSAAIERMDPADLAVIPGIGRVGLRDIREWIECDRIARTREARQRSAQ